jgi:hypothetical protein
MNLRRGGVFRTFLGELRRIPLPRTPVNKALFTCASYTPSRARHREGDGELPLPGAKNLDPIPLMRTCVRDYAAGRVYADPRIH